MSTMSTVGEVEAAGDAVWAAGEAFASGDAFASGAALALGVASGVPALGLAFGLATAVPAADVLRPPAGAVAGRVAGTRVAVASFLLLPPHAARTRIESKPIEAIGPNLRSMDVNLRFRW